MPNQYTKPMIDQDGWVEYRRLVLAELERLNTAVLKLDGNHSNIQVYITQTIAETKQILLDRLREAIQRQEADRDRLLKDLYADYERNLERLNDEHRENYNELQKMATRNRNDVVSLKVRAATLGAVAGFAVAAAGVAATIIFK